MTKLNFYADVVMLTIGNLPCELIHIIMHYAGKFICDYGAMHAVCRQWHALAQTLPYDTCARERRQLLLDALKRLASAAPELVALYLHHNDSCEIVLDDVTRNVHIFINGNGSVTCIRADNFDTTRLYAQYDMPQCVADFAKSFSEISKTSMAFTWLRNRVSIWRHHHKVLIDRMH